MKTFLFYCSFLCTLSLYAQPNTEVYLVDITTLNGTMTLTNLRNISNNEGYDNQPSFYDDNTLLYASTRNGQTDIASYNLLSGEVAWLTDTPDGSEYSPLRIPESEAISAVRLDTDGLQRLYEYDKQTGKSQVLLKDAKVGYHVWYSEAILVHTVLVPNGMDLMISNLKDGTNRLVQKNVGRSLHTIPNSNKISYISTEKSGSGIWTFNALDPISGETEVMQTVSEKIQDLTWLNEGVALFPFSTKINAYDIRNTEKIEPFHAFFDKDIYNISRVTISPDGTTLALVSEDPPYKIVQKQVDSYNASALDAFVNCYSKEVVVRNFPSDTLYMGHEKMRKNYSGLSPKNKNWEVEVLQRITIGNKVIDKERATGKHQENLQVALYEVERTSISSMTFIFDDKEAPNPEPIVQEQLDAYNKRDIDAFMSTYSENVALYNFPAELRSQGQKEMREGYAGYFKNTADLHCELKNRIVIGNKVIDEEYITANGTNFSAVAIYEVENGKIAKVTFLR